MRYRLRTLLIVLALGPPVLASGITHAPDEIAFWRKRKPVQVVTWKRAVEISRSVSTRGGPFVAEDKSPAQ